jgi:hypothetical protein
MGPRIVGDPRAEPFDHVDVGGQRDGPARPPRFRVDRSVPRHPRQVRKGDDVTDGSDIDERGSSCDREGGQGKALDRREGRDGGPTEMDERAALSADHMGIRQCRRLPEMDEIAQHGLAFEPPCQFQLASSAQFLVPPPGGGGHAQHAQDTCLHGNALHQERQTGTRPGPVQGTPKPLIRQSQNPKDTFTFPGPTSPGKELQGPARPQFSSLHAETPDRQRTSAMPDLWVPFLEFISMNYGKSQIGNFCWRLSDISWRCFSWAPDATSLFTSLTGNSWYYVHQRHPSQVLPSRSGPGCRDMRCPANTSRSSHISTS